MLPTLLLPPQMKESAHADGAYRSGQGGARRRVLPVWECGLLYNAAMTAASLGYNNVYWYRGGMHAWNQARLPVVRSKLLKHL